VSDASQLETWRLAYLGRKGRLTQVLRGLSALPLSERRRQGAEANRIKLTLELAHAERRRRLEQARVARVIESERLDVTLPGPPLPQGGLHPITQTLRDVLYAFETMGFRSPKV
jgi:phenylalanyl-tRNA synthetase alpha chain